MITSEIYLLFFKESHKPENIKRTYNIAWDALLIYLQVLSTMHATTIINDPIEITTYARMFNMSEGRITAGRKLLLNLKLISYTRKKNNSGKFCKRYLVINNEVA